MDERPLGEASAHILNDLKRQKDEIYEGLRELRNVILESNCDVEVEVFRDGYREALKKEVEEYLNKANELDSMKCIAEFNVQIEQTLQKLEEYLLSEQAYVIQLQNSTKSLENRIAYAREALKRAETGDGSAEKQITLEHVKLAKTKIFKVLKEALRRVIKAHFGDDKDMYIILRELMEGTKKEYIKITKDNYAHIRSLQSMHIVSENPYDNTEIKLSFD